MKQPKEAFVNKETWIEMFGEDTKLFNPLKGEIVFLDKEMKEPLLVKCPEIFD
jgi:hypothetical protein